MSLFDKIKIFFLAFIPAFIFGIGFQVVTSTQQAEAATSCCYTGDCVTCGGNQCTYIESCVPWKARCNPGNCGGGNPPTVPPNPGNPSPPGGGGNPPPPSCSSSTPGRAPTPLTPEDGATGLPNPVLFTWQGIGSNQWGTGCPQSNGYWIYYAVAPEGTVSSQCNGLGLSYSYASRGGNLNAALNLNWGKTYCWRVGASNGSATRLSGFRVLKVDEPPTRVFSGITSTDVCGTGVSGAANQTGVSNPITYTLTYTDPDSNDTFREVWLSFLIGSYSAATYTEAQVHNGARTYNTLAVKIDIQTGRAYTINAAGNWDAGALSGDLSNTDGSATLMDIGNSTVANVTGNTVTATFTIRFDANFPINNLNIYSAALMQASNGTLFTSNSTGAAPRRYQKDPGTWLVDVKPPTTVLAPPTYKADGTINVNWNFSDNKGVTGVYSYIDSDVAGSQLRDNGNGNVIITPGTNITYPNDPSNGGVTASGIRNYSDLTPENKANYTFKLFARDAACNVATVSANLQTPAPWIMGTGGNISGRGGIDKVRVPNITSFTLPPYITAPTEAFFVRNGAISGTPNNAKGNISLLNEYVMNYLDDASKPANLTDENWYPYLLDKVTRNSKTNVVKILSSQSISGNLANAFGVTANTKIAREILGDLNITAASQCNIKAMIFVQGNLTITPDLTIVNPPNVNPVINQTYNGCMFIVRGNTTIATGANKTPNIGITSAVLASYDIVNAFIVTDGNFIAPVDNLGATRKWDGLYINGGVIAKSTMNGGSSTLHRDINSTANNLQPSMYINLDPRYKLTFGEDLASKEYSIREYGLN